MKSYSPVQIRNPSSLQHVVKVFPGQRIELTLNESVFEQPHVEADGYLAVENAKKEKDNHTYLFCHPVDVIRWSKFSSCQLGEIWVDSKNRFSKLIVVLESDNLHKLDHIAVVNPVANDMRLKPQNIVEVILFDETFSAQDEWTWEWKPDLELGVTEIGRATVNAYSHHKYGHQTDDPSFRYAVCPRSPYETTPNVFMRQHHFWFRFDNRVFNFLNQDQGTLKAGHLSFEGVSSCFSKQSAKRLNGVTLFVDFHKKHRERVYKTMAMMTLEECEKFGVRHVPMCGPEVHPQPHPAYTAYPAYATYPVQSCVPIKKRKKFYPVEREVILEKIEGDLAEGCKVIPYPASIYDDDEEDWYNS